jgi:glycosyltransferase involved in cell wall biosynthesis
MAAGKPVVATKVGGSPEMVRDGITGYLVPPADSHSLENAVIDLLQDPSKIISMGEAGRRIVQEKFAVESMVKSYENLYQSLISKHR